MVYVFDDYELDTRLYELRRAGVPVKLERQSFNVLAFLVQHRDRVVTRQELFEHLWPDRFVSDAALERCIAVARRAVGDSGRAQRIIQTIHGRGYRFVAAVEETAASARDPTDTVPSVVSAPQPQTRPAPPVLHGEHKPVTVLCGALLTSEATKRLVPTAAILGRRFSVRLLETIWHESEGLESHLEELKRREFLYEQRGAKEPIYAFKHALTRDVAYESLLQTHRQTLHATAGQALETLYAGRLVVDGSPAGNANTGRSSASKRALVHGKTPARMPNVHTD